MIDIGFTSISGASVTEPDVNHWGTGEASPDGGGFTGYVEVTHDDDAPEGKTNHNEVKDLGGFTVVV